MKKIVVIFAMSFLMFSCSENTTKEKGFSVSEAEQDESNPNGIVSDSLVFKTSPSNVILTSNPEHRLLTIFKINYNKKTKEPFTGSNDYHYGYYGDGENNKIDNYGNNWNNNIIPGFEALYGYNIVNVSHFNFTTEKQNNFFEKPTLIKTLYYPSFSKDTLNFKPVNRNFYMISCYDEDTNKDGKVNFSDLRRFYWFDIEGQNKKAIIPANYSIVGSDYDFANDYLYMYAKLDKNNNGTIDNAEEKHIFWIDLKNPEKVGKQY